MPLVIDKSQSSMCYRSQTVTNRVLTTTRAVSSIIRFTMRSSRPKNPKKICTHIEQSATSSLTPHLSHGSSQPSHVLIDRDQQARLRQSQEFTIRNRQVTLVSRHSRQGGLAVKTTDAARSQRKRRRKSEQRRPLIIVTTTHLKPETLRLTNPNPQTRCIQ